MIFLFIYRINLHQRIVCDVLFDVAVGLGVKHSTTLVCDSQHLFGRLSLPLASIPCAPHRCGFTCGVRVTMWVDCDPLLALVLFDSVHFQHSVFISKLYFGDDVRQIPNAKSNDQSAKSYAITHRERTGCERICTNTKLFVEIFV